MTDIEKRARTVEAQLREQASHHRDLSNPLYMSAHGRLLHEAAEVIAALVPANGYVLVPIDSVEQLRGRPHQYMCRDCGVVLGGFDPALPAAPEEGE